MKFCRIFDKPSYTLLQSQINSWLQEVQNEKVEINIIICNYQMTDNRYSAFFMYEFKTKEERI